MTAAAVWHNLTLEPGLYVFRVGGAVLVFIASLLAGRFLANRVRRALARTSVGPNPTVLLARLTRSVVYVIGLLWILAIFSVPFTALAAVVSISVIALSLSLQDLLKNLIAGVYLLAERPFHIGDEITVSGVTGIIDDIQMRVTLLHTGEGERVIMPNQTVFTQVVVSNTVAGARLSSLMLTFPRSLDAEDVRRRSREATAGLPSLAPTPAATLEPVGVSPEATKWLLSVWLRAGHDLSEVILALGTAVPEVIIEQPGSGS